MGQTREKPRRALARMTEIMDKAYCTTGLSPPELFGQCPAGFIYVERKYYPIVCCQVTHKYESGVLRRETSKT